MNTTHNPLSNIEGTHLYSAEQVLKEKIGKDVDLRKDIFTDEVITKSQQVINDRAASFLDELHTELDGLQSDYNAINAAPSEALLHIEHMIIVARSIKGQAETLGYEMIAKIANSLIQYNQTVNKCDDKILMVIKKHIDTLYVAVSQKLKGDGGALGKELEESLQKLSLKFSSKT